MALGGDGNPQFEPILSVPLPGGPSCLQLRAEPVDGKRAA